MIRILIADDHALFRELLRELIPRLNQDWMIIGEAETREEARALILRQQPDLVLLDYGIVGTEHISSFCQEIAALGSSPRILILSGYLDEPTVLNAVAGGVHGYVVKGASVDVLTEAIRAVLTGEIWVDPVLHPDLVKAFKHSRPSSEDNC